MPILNYDRLSPILLSSNKERFVKILSTDSTVFNISSLTTNFATQPTSWLDPTVSDANIDRDLTFSNRFGILKATITAYPVNGYLRFGSYGGDSTSDFNFQFRFGKMDILNLYTDSSASINFGLNSRPDSTVLGSFYAQLDSPLDSKRRFRIFYNKANNPLIELYSKTESTIGEFGDTTLFKELICGTPIRQIRFARAGNRLICEWNYGVDSRDVDYTNTFCKLFKNKVDIFINSFPHALGGGSLNKFIFNSNGQNMSPDIHIRVATVDTIFEPMVQINRFDSLPAVTFNRDLNPTDLRIHKITGDTIEGFSKPRGQASDTSVMLTVQDIVGTVNKITNTSGISSFEKTDMLSGRTTQFMFDNLFNRAKTEDLNTDLYIGDVYRETTNYGNIYPSLSLNNSTVRLDKTYALQICKHGTLQERYAFGTDSTNLLNTFGGASAFFNSKASVGQNDLPQYLFNDSTYWYGREAKFSVIEHMLITATAGETPIRDEYKVFDRDSTSYYVLETISDGTNFKVHTRVFNFLTKTLGSRVAVNATVPLTIVNQMYQPDGASRTLTFNFATPKADILVFPDKHVLAMNCDYLNTNQSHRFVCRVFYESFDSGTTWSLARSGSSFSFIEFQDVHTYSEDVVSLKIPGNDKSIFTFVSSSVTPSGQFSPKLKIYHTMKDNYATKDTFTNYLKYSILKNDDTIYRISPCFDNVQKRFTLGLVGLNTANVEILRGPYMPNGSLDNFESFLSSGWISDFYINAPITIGVSRTFHKDIHCAVDNFGDIVSVLPGTLDATSFGLLRTNFNKTQFELMGRFLQCSRKAASSKARYIGNSTVDSDDNILLTTSAEGASSLETYFTIMKYGLSSNQPVELDFDEGFLYPQELNVLGGSVSVDSTIAGALINVSTDYAIQSDGEKRYLDRPYNIYIGIGAVYRGGFKSEWRMFNEPIYTDTTNAGGIISFYLEGRKLAAASWEQSAIAVGWDITSIWAYDRNTNARLGKALVDPKKLRKYRYVVERTTDNSYHGQIYSENLDLSDNKKIVWDKKLDFVSPFTNVGAIVNTIVIGTGATTPFHVQYLFASRTLAPTQTTRRSRLLHPGEGITSRSTEIDKEYYNGFSCHPNESNNHDNNIVCRWSGFEGEKNDKFTFEIDSATHVSTILEKEPFKVWRSVSDSTTSVIVMDATDNGIHTLSANMVVFKNANFRRCFVEAANQSLLNAATPALYSKEIFFDDDEGIINDTVHSTTGFLDDGYATALSLNDPNKSWRPGEHTGKFIQFEHCRYNLVNYKHVVFKILDNDEKNVTFYIGDRSVDLTAGMRYLIYDGNLSVRINPTSPYSYWRIRIPEAQSGNGPFIGDETAQGRIFYENYREIGEFDIGRITHLEDDIDSDSDIALLSSQQKVNFENLSSISFETSRVRRSKKFKYTTTNPIQAQKLRNMFVELYGSNKTLWMFDDQEDNPREFMLCRIINEPDFERTNDGIHTISLDVEEIN